MEKIIDEIAARQNITREQLEAILAIDDEKHPNIVYLHEKAREVADGIYGKEVYGNRAAYRNIPGRMRVGYAEKGRTISGRKDESGTASRGRIPLRKQTSLF